MRAKMFRVIVLGGVALVDCGARTDLGRPLAVDASRPIADASEEEASPGFPQETGAPLFDAGAIDTGFPQEANAPIPGDEK